MGATVDFSAFLPFFRLQRPLRVEILSQQCEERGVTLDLGQGDDRIDLLNARQTRRALEEEAFIGFDIGGALFVG